MIFCIFDNTKHIFIFGNGIILFFGSRILFLRLNNWIYLSFGNLTCICLVLSKFCSRILCWIDRCSNFKRSLSSLLLLLLILILSNNLFLRKSLERNLFSLRLLLRRIVRSFLDNHANCDVVVVWASIIHNHIFVLNHCIVANNSFLTENLDVFCHWIFHIHWNDWKFHKLLLRCISLC